MIDISVYKTNIPYQEKNIALIVGMRPKICKLAASATMI